MATDSPNLSIAELERLLETKKDSLLDLAQRREDLVKQIAGLDQEIQQMADLRGMPRRQRPKRLPNATPLRTVLLDVLKKNKKGFKLDDLAVKIAESGYRSASQNFSNVVYQCIYNTPEVELDEKTGCYRLKK